MKQAFSSVLLVIVPAAANPQWHSPDNSSRKAEILWDN